MKLSFCLSAICLIALLSICFGQENPNPSIKVARITETPGLGWNGLGIGADGSFLFVNEWGPSSKGIYLGLERSGQVKITPLSLSKSFTDPEYIVEADDGFYVTNNGAGPRLLFVRKDGGIPLPFQTESTFNGNNMFGMERVEPIINPYGILLAPTNFEGDNVSPGDLIVFDNAHGKLRQSSIWAVNRSTGDKKMLANAANLPQPFFLGTFSQDGTLYAALNANSHSGITIVRIDHTGLTEIVLSAFGAVPPTQPVANNKEVGIAAHPQSDGLYFSIYGDVYVMNTTDYKPRLVKEGEYTVHMWSADGRFLYCQRAGATIELCHFELSVTVARKSAIPENNSTAPAETHFVTKGSN
jgi:hypothetical protein